MMAELEESIYPELTLNMKRIGYLDDRTKIVTIAQQAIEEVLIDLSLVMQEEIITGFLKDRVQNSIPSYLFMHKHMEEIVSIYQENKEIREFLENVYFHYSMRTAFFDNKRTILIEELSFALVPSGIEKEESLVNESIRSRYPDRPSLRTMLNESHWAFTIALLQLARPFVISLFIYNQNQLLNAMVNNKPNIGIK